MLYESLSIFIGAQAGDFVDTGKMRRVRINPCVARFRLPPRRSPRLEVQNKTRNLSISGLICGAPGQSKSEPISGYAWEERERGRESSFAFERSGSIRAEGAAPGKGEILFGFPLFRCARRDLKSMFFIPGILIHPILRNTNKNQKNRYQSVHPIMPFPIWLGSFLWSGRKAFTMELFFEETGGTYSILCFKKNFLNYGPIMSQN